MPENIGKLLDYEGIPVTRTEHANFENLVNAQQNSQRVIVGLNTNDIWHPQHDSMTGEALPLPYAGLPPG